MHHAGTAIQGGLQGHRIPYVSAASPGGIEQVQAAQGAAPRERSDQGRADEAGRPRDQDRAFGYQDPPSSYRRWVNLPSLMGRGKLPSIGTKA